MTTKKEYMIGGRAQFNNSNDFKYRLEGLASSTGLSLSSIGSQSTFRYGATILDLTVTQITAGNGTNEYHLGIEDTNIATTQIQFLTGVTGTTSVEPTGGDEIVEINEGLHARGKRLSGTAKPIMSFSAKILRNLS